MSGPQKFIHICGFNHKVEVPGGYYECKKCCRECFVRCICDVRYCKVCGKDCAYIKCEHWKGKKMSSDNGTRLKEKMEEAQKKFDECVTTLKKIEEEQTKLLNAHKAVWDEANIWKGKYNAFKELADAERDGGASKESGRILDSKVGVT